MNELIESPILKMDAIHCHFDIDLIRVFQEFQRTEALNVDFDAQQKLLSTSIRLAAISVTAYILCLCTFIHFDYFMLMYSIGCILFQGHIISTQNPAIHAACWILSISISMSITKTEKDHFSPTMLTILLMHFVRNLITDDNVRRSADGKRFHWMFQYPMWLLAISVTALSRTQILRSRVAVESFVLESAVFGVSVLLVMMELYSMAVPQGITTNILVVGLLWTSFKGMMFVMLILLKTPILKSYLADDPRRENVMSFIEEMEYLCLFKALLSVRSICYMWRQMVFCKRTKEAMHKTVCHIQIGISYGLHCE